LAKSGELEHSTKHRAATHSITERGSPADRAEAKRLLSNAPPGTACFTCLRTRSFFPETPRPKAPDQSVPSRHVRSRPKASGSAECRQTPDCRRRSQSKGTDADFQKCGCDDRVANRAKCATCDQHAGPPRSCSGKRGTPAVHSHATTASTPAPRTPPATAH